MEETDAGYWMKNQSRLLECGRGKYVLTVGKEIIGIYDTEAEASGAAKDGGLEMHIVWFNGKIEPIGDIGMSIYC
jgi:hypothetical protein